MKKITTYEAIFFSANVLRESLQAFRSQVDPEGESEFSYFLGVEIASDAWIYDSLEEFMADYRKGSGEAYCLIESKKTRSANMKVKVHGNGNGRLTIVEIGAPSRSQIQAISEVFERNIDDSRLPIEPSYLKPTVFIGHGHSHLWRDLKDHLQDQHHYDVTAYEIGARAGHTLRDILEDMLNKSSFAILVMTGEDETRNDELHPRLNVVHELGLFQGHLGFSRSIALLEEGTEEFSNIHGIHQIRFSKGSIKETFGDVLATINREFGKAT